MATTALALIKQAFNLIGVYQPNETPDAVDAQNALLFLNGMVGQWSLQTGTIPYRAREVFAMVADQGGPSNPYTIGSGGNWDTSRPMRLEGAGLILTQSQPNPVEVVLALLTDDGYDAIQVKDLSNNQPTAVYYQPTSPLGSVYLWPVPNVAYNTMAIYRLKQLDTFSSLAASYATPAGYDQSIAYNLAVLLSDAYAKVCPPNVQRIAATSLTILKRPNYRFNDMPQDIFTGDRRYGYNIQTGNL